MYQNRNPEADDKVHLVGQLKVIQVKYNSSGILVLLQVLVFLILKVVILFLRNANMPLELRLNLFFCIGINM